MKTLSLWIFGLLFISLPGAHGLSQFPESFVLAKRSDAAEVTLTCNAETGDAVTWKFHGEEMEDVMFDQNVYQRGQHLIMSDVDTPMLGQYSCWRGGQMLSSVSLLLEAEEEETSDLLHCWAKSYDCDFSCKWNSSRYSAVRLELGNDCSDGERSCHWISSRKQHSDGGFLFKLSHSLSPYAEESTMLKVTAEAITDLSVLRKTKTFYLRDIVQPDSPVIVRCQKLEQGLHVTIVPPSSWSTPHSFFSLEHQIEYVLKDDGQVRLSSSPLIPLGISKLRARSRDPLVISNWSHWSRWQNVTC